MALDLEDVLEQAVSDIQGMIDTGFVEESDDDLYKAFGGKKGEGRVSVPKNITDKQILAYFDFIGRPLSTKEEKAEVVGSIRSKLSTPDVATTKTSKTATLPMAEDAPKVDYLERIRSGKATVRDVFEAVLDKKLTDNNRKTIQSLFNALPDEGIDLDAPYFDVYDSREFYEAFDYTTNTTGVHRYKEFGAFETQLEGLIRTSKRNEPYARLSDAQGKKGIASDNGLTGTQIRAKDPMRSLVPTESLDQIYQNALSKDSYEEYTKSGTKVTRVISEDTRDYLIYEKYTGQRLESNIGVDGLKVGDVSFYTDENGNRVANIVEKISANKTRPATTYVGPFAEFLEDKVNRRMASLPEGADITKADLFDTTPKKVEDVWNALIRPELEKKHSRQLPAGKQGSHSVLRKILARQLVQELRFPKDAVKSWMGHAGAGVDSSGDILEESYTGAVPDERISSMTDSFVRNDAFNTKSKNVNLLFVNRGITSFSSVSSAYDTPENKVVYSSSMNLNEPSQRRLATDGEVREISAAANSRAIDIEMANLTKEEELSEAKRQAALKREENKRADAERRSRMGISTPQPSAAKPEEFTEFSEGLKARLEALNIKIPGVVKKAMGPIGYVGLTAATVGTYSRVSEAAEQAGVPEPVAKGLGVAAGATEVLPLTYSDVESLAAGRAEPSMITPAGRVAAEEQMYPGSTGLGPSIVPEEPTVQGFVSPRERAIRREEAAAAAQEPMGFISP